MAVCIAKINIIAANYILAVTHEGIDFMIFFTQAHCNDVNDNIF